MIIALIVYAWATVFAFVAYAEIQEGFPLAISDFLLALLGSLLWPFIAVAYIVITIKEHWR